MDNDKEWDRKLTVAERATLGELIEEHQSRLLAILRWRMDPVLAARVSAEELLQDAFMDAHRRWATYLKNPPDASPFCWLYRIALDRLKDRWKRETAQRRDVRREMPWPEQSSAQLGFSLVRQDTTPSRALVREELRQRMHETVNMLKSRDREVLWMRFFDSLSFKEIGQILDVTENTAAVRYVRAIERLKKLWNQIESHDER